jgi:hypothetical protein
MLVTLGAAPPSGATEVSDVALLCAVVLSAGVVTLWFLYSSEKKRRLEVERAAAARPSHGPAGGAGPSERDTVMFNQHRRMNELATAKLEAEVALLQAQLKVRIDDEDRLQASKEFHELNVEKTKLEIDSLRLHIAEQRKRLDEFGLGGA